MLALRYNGLVAIVEYGPSDGTWGDMPNWYALRVVVERANQGHLALPWQQLVPREIVVPAQVTGEEIRALVTATSRVTAHQLRWASIALDPLTAALEGVGYPMYSGLTVSVVRVATGCFGTSHLPNPRWARRFLAWGSPPSRGERLLAADISTEIGVVFGGRSGREGE